MGQDSYSRMYKGEWQKTCLDRSFFDLIAARFTLDAPFTSSTDAAINPPTADISTGRTTGAPFNLGNSTRNKPQLKAQLTHYLPGDVEVTTSSSASRRSTTRIDSEHRRHGADRIPRRRTGCRFAWCSSTSARRPTTAARGDHHRPWTSTTARTVRIAGRRAGRLTITAGVRVDDQDALVRDGKRGRIRPVITDGDLSGEDHRFGRRLVRTTNLARAWASPTTHGNAPDGAEGVLRTLLQQPRRSFSAANPGGDNRAQYKFNDLNHNGRYDGPQELGALRFRIGGASAPSIRICGRRSPRSSADPSSTSSGANRRLASRRTQEQSRFRPVLLLAVHPRVDRSADGADERDGHQPIGQAETFSVLDIPESLRALRRAVRQHPGQRFPLHTIETAVRSHVGRRFFVQASGDYQWRDELRTADLAALGEPVSAVDRSDRGQFLPESESDDSEPSAHDHVPAAGAGPIRLSTRRRGRRELPLSERLSLLPNHPGRRRCRICRPRRSSSRT